MENIACRLDGELFQINMYDLAFQTSIGLPVEVQDSGTWIAGTSWSPLKDFIAGLKSKISKHLKIDRLNNTKVFFYAGPDFVLSLSRLEFVCAIARNPRGEHHIRPFYGDYWGDWKLYREEYHFIRTIASELEDWPEFDKSNPNIRSQSETHFQTQLGGYQPNSLHDGSLETKSSVDMTLHKNFNKQYHKQIRYPSRGILLCRNGISYRLNTQREKIEKHIQKTLLRAGEIYLPYIGRLHLKGHRLCFQASRLLRDRIHGRKAPEHRLNNNRAYGGEKQPGQSLQLWGHRKDYQLSRIRQLVDAIGSKGVRGTTMVAYQAFSDSIIFRLTQGVNVTLKGVGTLRVNPSQRVS